MQYNEKYLLQVLKKFNEQVISIVNRISNELDVDSYNTLAIKI